MKSVFVVAVASRTPEWLARAEAEYAARIVGFRLRTIVVKPTTANKTAAAILAKAPPRARILLLDADGESADSEEFARKLQNWLAESRPPFFVIGGADGLPPPLRAHAEELLSLSPLTFAHAVARFVLAEQLFRADCILRNHPYPR